MKSRFQAGILTLLVAFGFSSSAGAMSLAPANYVFTFAGACQDCSVTAGPGSASATLDLVGYLLGDPLSLSNVSGFTYSSGLLGTLVADTFIGTAGNIYSMSASSNAFWLGFRTTNGMDYSFVTKADGSWDIGALYVTDYGLAGSSTWSGTVANVPEPETYAMLLAGLGLMGPMLRRRMKRT